MSLLEFMGEHPIMTFFLVWLTYEFVTSMTKIIKGVKKDDES